MTLGQSHSRAQTFFFLHKREQLFNSPRDVSVTRGKVTRTRGVQSPRGGGGGGVREGEVEGGGPVPSLVPLCQCAHIRGIFPPQSRTTPKAWKGLLVSVNLGTYRSAPAEVSGCRSGFSQHYLAYSLGPSLVGISF